MPEDSDLLLRQVSNTLGAAVWQHPLLFLGGIIL